MTSKKKIRKKTLSSELNDATLPKKGKPTFSVVDGIGNNQQSNNDLLLVQILQAFNEDKTINLNVIDDRSMDPIINVEPKINVERPPPVHINVKPTPIEIKVPTQRIPEIRPRFEVINEIDFGPLIWVGVMIVLILALDVGMKFWQLQM